MRGPSEAAVRAWWSWAAGDALADVRDALLARLAVDRDRYGDVFEPSISVDERGVSRLRFSYGFPGWRAEPDAIADAARALLRPLGDAARATLEPVLRAARDPAVSHPIVGLAVDADGGTRAKLYLQLRDDAARRAHALAAAVTGCALASEAPLHLVGIDVGEAGVRGAKLYLRADVAGERDGLHVHRFTGPADPRGAIVSDIDFAIDDLARRPEAQRLVEELPVGLPIRARRLSVSVPPGRRLTLYYTLA